MKAYVVYVITDHYYPLAITTDKSKAEQYMKKCKEKDKYYLEYWISTIDISNIFEIDSI